jgi:hypothetical protein
MPREAESEDGHHKERAGEELDDRVLPRDPVSAATALPLQEKEAENGDIVIRLDRRPTIGTSGTRDNDTLTLGESVDADIAKTPHDESEHEAYGDAQGIAHDLRS